MRYFVLLLIATTVYATSAAPLETGFTDDDSPVIEYAGTWLEITDASAINGAYQQADNVADTVSIETYATGVTLFFVFDPAGGTVDVCVNGAECLAVNTIGATARGKIEISDLAAGDKTITVTKSADDASVFNFDGVYIHPSAETAKELNQVEFEYNGETVSANLPLEITSGDMVIAILLSVIAAFNVIRFAFDMRNQN